MVLFNFCVLVGCVCCLFGASASHYPYLFPFSSFSSSFLAILFSFGIIYSIVLLIIIFHYLHLFLLLIFLLLTFLLSCFLLLITSVITNILPFFSYFLRWSLLIVLAVLVPPLSHLLCFLLPPPPRAHTSEGNTGKNKYLTLCAYVFLCENVVSKFLVWKNNGKNKYLILIASVFLCENVLSKACLYFFVGFLCPQNMFVSLSSNLFSWSRRFFIVSFLLLFCCLLFWERTFFRSKFSFVPGFFALVIFSVRALVVFVLLVSFFVLRCSVLLLPLLILSWLLLFPSCFSSVFSSCPSSGSFLHWTGKGLHILVLFS